MSDLEPDGLIRAARKSRALPAVYQIVSSVLSVEPRVRIDQIFLRSRVSRPGVLAGVVSAPANACGFMISPSAPQLP